MKTIKNLFSKNVQEIDFVIWTTVKKLDSLGWDFNNEIMAIIEQRENHLDSDKSELDYDKVKAELFEDVVELTISGTPEKFATTYEINSFDDFVSRISNGCANSTGDDEETVKDIIQILKEGFSINYRSVGSLYDRSVDGDYNYTPLFSEFPTQEMSILILVQGKDRCFDEIEVILKGREIEMESQIISGKYMGIGVKNQEICQLDIDYIFKNSSNNTELVQTICDEIESALSEDHQKDVTCIVESKFNYNN